eukprot:5455209-Heterocapsa_arctica.AAC.1
MTNARKRIVDFPESSDCTFTHRVNKSGCKFGLKEGILSLIKGSEKHNSALRTSTFRYRLGGGSGAGQGMVTCCCT